MKAAATGVHCPHCEQPTRSRVLESRPHEGSVWRRRLCLRCQRVYVSAEHAPAGLRMPTLTSSRHRSPPTQAPTPPEAPRGDGAHLVGLWR
jgi:hypothetical protein